MMPDRPMVLILMVSAGCTAMPADPPVVHRPEPVANEAGATPVPLSEPPPECGDVPGGPRAQAELSLWPAPERVNVGDQLFVTFESVRIPRDAEPFEFEVRLFGPDGRVRARKGTVNPPTQERTPMGCDPVQGGGGCDGPAPLREVRAMADAIIFQASDLDVAGTYAIQVCGTTGTFEVEGTTLEVTPGS